MKRMKTWMFALIVSMGALLTSCINTDGDYTPTGGGIVEVGSLLGTPFFTDVSGLRIYPTPSSLATVESKLGFKTGQTKVAYVLFTYSQEGNEAAAENKQLNNANLQFASSLDRKIETVNIKGAANDSVTTAPVLKLRSVFDAGSASNQLNELYLQNNRYLMTGIEYLFLRERHYFSLMYYPEEQEEGKLIFNLKHTGNAETSDVYSTSYAYMLAGYDPSIYFSSFDIMPYLNLIGNPETVTIEVHAEVNQATNELDKATKKVYTLVHNKK